MTIDVKLDPATGIRASACPANLRAGMEALEGLAQDIATLERALRELSELTGDEARRPVARLEAQLGAFEPAVTVLGQVKAGKTSLINAMAGWADLLPSDVNPWTSVVTSLHLTPAEQRAETGARFQFMTEEEWDRLTRKGGRIGELAGRAGADGELAKIRDQITAMREKSRARLGRNFELLMGQEHEYSYFDKNLLERYICLGDDFDVAEDDPADQGRFADITRSADLYLNCRSVPCRLCLRDTPGVNDTFMMREMVTIKAVRDARICVVVLSATQALTSVDMALIRMISNLKSREVIIFVNRVDELSDPPAQMIEIEGSIRDTLKAQNGPEEAEIVFGSAYWANKVLMGELGAMHPASAEALLTLTRAVLGTTKTERSPADLIWEMSGLPRLMRALSTRITESLGAPFLTKTAVSALALATTEEAAQTVRVQGDGYSSDISMQDIRTAFEEIAERSLDGFDSAIDEVLSDYKARADRAHATFIDRATHSLLDHLERQGDAKVWDYDPAGLRMLLRSSYSSMGNRVRKIALARYEGTVSDVAHLLYRGFGPAVEGIALAVPDVPPLPSPVALAQTIALDFNDSWWATWWRKTRGYKAFAKQFSALIRAETEDFMTQMKEVQTADIKRALRAELSGFLDDQRDILKELMSGAQRRGQTEALFTDADRQERQKALETTIATLRRLAP